MKIQGLTCDLLAQSIGMVVNLAVGRLLLHIHYRKPLSPRLRFKLSTIRKMSKKPVIYVHAFTDTDPSEGVPPHWETHVKKYFDLITSEDLRKDSSQAHKVEGALLFGARLSLLYEHLPQFKNIKIVANFGVGTNHIDFPKFANLGIKVSNTPDVLNDAVAEMTIGLMLASARHILPGNAIVRGTKESRYRMNSMPGLEIKNSTVGIVGLGNIGLAIAHLLKAFKSKVVYHNRNRRSVEDEHSVGATYYPNLEEMLMVSDFVVIMCPLTSSTKHLIGERQLAAMKPTATLVNVGRGPVVNTDALVDALRTNKIRGAALDVTDPEPLPVEHPLRTEFKDRVVLTPHWGSNTFTTRFDMFKICVDNLRAELIDKVPIPNEVKA